MEAITIPPPSKKSRSKSVPRSSDSETKTELRADLPLRQQAEEFKLKMTRDARLDWLDAPSSTDTSSHFPGISSKFRYCADCGVTYIPGPLTNHHQHDSVDFDYFYPENVKKLIWLTRFGKSYVLEIARAEFQIESLQAYIDYYSLYIKQLKDRLSNHRFLHQTLHDLRGDIKALAVEGFGTRNCKDRKFINAALALRLFNVSESKQVFKFLEGTPIPQATIMDQEFFADLEMNTKGVVQEGVIQKYIQQAFKFKGLPKSFFPQSAGLPPPNQKKHRLIQAPEHEHQTRELRLRSHATHPGGPILGKRMVLESNSTELSVTPEDKQ